MPPPLWLALSRALGHRHLMPTTPPYGRRLKDFGELSIAETRLLRAAAHGEVCVIAPGRPEQANPDNRVRADFIRCLALGGDDGNPVHENGVRLVGAWIVGMLKIDFCTLSGPLLLLNCRLNRLSAREAQLTLINLDGTSVEAGIEADGIRVTGDIFLTNNFQACGGVRLLGARIGGDLTCSGSFENKNGDALNFDRANIAGSVFLKNSFNAVGEVRLLNAEIGGDFDCSGGSFNNMGADALFMNRSVIKGAVFLNEGFAVNGCLSFAEAQIGSLRDQLVSWPEQGKLQLDGMTLGRLGSGAPTSGAQRVAWLNRQVLAHLTSDFCPQPWEEMVRVLRAMGHDEDARIVAIAKQDQLREAGKIEWRQQLWRPFSTRRSDGGSARFSVVGWALHGLWGRLAGYGYRPLRLFGWMLAVWAIGSGLFWMGMKGGYMAPTSPIVITNGSIDAACDAGPDAGDRRWTLCAKLPDEYSTFQPMAYSLDLILPVISLQQDTEWAPVVGNATGWYWPGIGLRALMWFEILFGWMGSLLLIAIFTNLVKKD